MLVWLIRPFGGGKFETPASSPCDEGISESSTHAPLLAMTTFSVHLSAVLSIPVLGNGVGIPPGPAGGGGAGMLHTSGVPSAVPPSFVAAGGPISSPSTDQDLVA